jgi:MoaA/NifB/PqqE/SkfB family radical SAM enzyme
MDFSIGIGLTNDCNLNCAHCYRPTDQIYQLSLSDVKIICEHLPVSAMGMGTGENGLHPQFSEIVVYLRDRGIKLTMASNGYSLNAIPEEILRAFHDVEVSIDFPTEQEQDLFRGRGNWHDVHAAIERCQGLGIEVSILATMMNNNYDKMRLLVQLARTAGTNLRVNVYQAVQTDRFRLSYEQFWEGYRQLLSSAQLVSCSEPVVRAVLGQQPVFSPCGSHSIRFTPQGSIVPCVYWPRSTLTIRDVPRLGEQIVETSEFKLARQVPPSAQDCPCQGGCASRRALAGNLDQHDEYCPWVRGDEIHLDFEMASHKDLPRGKNVCTTIVV